MDEDHIAALSPNNLPGMPRWDPEQYSTFADHRIRPALDLLNRIPLIDPETVWDLGCGTGSITRLLRDRWPGADVTGLDSSPEMLEQARNLPVITWVLGSIEDWTPPQPAGVIYANASLHWVPNHDALFPRLAGYLAPGGVLAVQMPRNFDLPSHTLLYETAAEPSWADRVGHLPTASPIAGPARYHDLLAPHCEAVDVWETTYLQVLTGSDPVAAWTRGTAARPYLDALGADGEAFMADYAARLRDAYPPSPDGTTIFPMRRVFAVALH
jgi:trans-aconitate 2-methyltransferase